MHYLNRLSDLLFVLARSLNRIGGNAEVIWTGGKLKETEWLTAANGTQYSLLCVLTGGIDRLTNLLRGFDNARPRPADEVAIYAKQTVVANSLEIFPRMPRHLPRIVVLINCGQNRIGIGHHHRLGVYRQCNAGQVRENIGPAAQFE